MSGDWYMRSDVTAGLDIAVLAALAIAILVGLHLAWRLKALRRTHAQWNTEMAAFTEKTDATEASLERLRLVLLAEAAHRREQESALTPVSSGSIPEVSPIQAPDLTPKPSPATATKDKQTAMNRRANAVLSMQ